MTPAEQFSEKILQLQDRIHTAHPQMPVLLREIHKQLKADPEIVTLATDEEIAILVSGLKKQTGIELAQSMTKGKQGKSLKKLTEDDL